MFVPILKARSLNLIKEKKEKVLDKETKDKKKTEDKKTEDKKTKKTDFSLQTTPNL